ncbi:MAG: SAM-dependent methyltransferase [Halobacteriaceae archaeon]
MSVAVREQVRDSARYLREVRPIDPEEVAAYVEGGAHPAVVRRVLREEAFALGLVERPDGTFVPVPDGPLVPGEGGAPAFDGVDALPAAHDRRLADLLAERFGPDWAEGESGGRLRNRLRELKAAYFRGGASEVTYDEVTALAYAVYHLADFYAATQYVLHELGGDGLLDRRLRVLDVGAGVGGPALALHDYCLGGPGIAEGDDREDDHAPPARVEYHALEPGGGAGVLDALLAETGENFRATVHETRVEEFDPAKALGGAPGGAEGVGDAPADADAQFDLVLFANVLSELDAPVDAVRDALDWLAPEGTVAAVAPADLETATGLRAVEREVVGAGDAAAYAPTAWLWPNRDPTDRGWSFDRQPPIAEPETQRRLAAPADHPEEVTNTSVKFAYTLLRPDYERRHDVTLTRERAIPLGDADEVVTDRVDLVVSKLSRDLRAVTEADAADEPSVEAGNPIFKVGDGSESVECYAVLVQEGMLNEGLRAAGYGAILAMENALVLWNDDEGAYNAVVDEETVVDVVGRGAPYYGTSSGQ